MISFLVAFSVTAMADEVSWVFHDAPLQEALSYYTKLSGKPVRIPAGVNAVVTSQTTEPVPRDRAVAIFEQELENNFIGLLPLPDGTLEAKMIRMTQLTVTNYPLNIALATVGASCDMRIAFNETLTNTITADFPEFTPAPRIMRFLMSEMHHAGLEMALDSNGVYTVWGKKVFGNAGGSLVP